MELIIACSNCKSKLKVNLGNLKSANIKCPVCQMDNTVTQEETKETTADGWLMIRKGSAEKFFIQPGINTIGRKAPSSTADIQLPVEDSFLGRNHFTIERIVLDNKQPEFILKDNKSVNGTFINGGMKLNADEEIFLVHNDIIKAGQTELIFKTQLGELKVDKTEISFQKPIIQL